MARIFIVGSGVVGEATGKGFLSAGHNVTFIDIAPARIEKLRADGLDARDELDLVDEPASFIFLTLPTPNVGHRYDLTAFAAGTASVGDALKVADAVHTVVVRSTVPPGTTEGLVQSTVEERSGKTVGEGYALAANPEFLRAASALDDFRWPWMTVIGSRSVRTIERLRALLAPFGGAMHTFTDPAAAEFVKCAHNIFNATKISFWNEMWLVARALNLDLDPIAQTVAESAEGSFNPRYGIRGGAPYGGVCLPKDTQGFLGFAADVQVDMPLLRAVVDVNDRLRELLAREVETWDAASPDAPAEPTAAERPDRTPVTTPVAAPVTSSVTSPVTSPVTAPTTAPTTAPVTANDAA